MGAEASYEFSNRGDDWTAYGSEEEVQRFRETWENMSKNPPRKRSRTYLQGKTIQSRNSKIRRSVEL